MSDRYVIEAWLRPAVELNSALVSGGAAFVCAVAPWAVALSPSVSYVTAGAFAGFSALRAHQGFRVLRYRRNLRRLPRYQVTSAQVPVSRQRLFLGKGFQWQQNTRNACWKPSVRKWSGMFSRRHITGWPGSLNSVLNPVFRRFAGFCKRQLAESGPPADAGGGIRCYTVWSRMR